jgi:Condensation domain
MTIPVQVIGDGGVKTDRHNFSLTDPQQQLAEIDSLMEQAGQTDFDFQQEPLFHASLICLSQTRHMLVITLPALYADGVGLNNLVREISRCYSAFVGGEDLSDEPMQYADLSEWQNELLEKQDAEIGRRYWRQKDYAALDSMKLPFGKQPSEQGEYRPQRASLTLRPEIVTQRHLHLRFAAFLLASLAVEADRTVPRHRRSRIRWPKVRRAR